MEITEQQRDQAYEAATQQQKYLYAHPDSGLKLWSIASKYNLTEDGPYTNFVILVGDVVLNLRNRTELPTLLTQTLGVTSEQAVKITADLIGFLDQTTEIKKTNDLTPEIEETEAALKAIPNIRTMSQDMAASQAQAKSEPTYTSTQEAILKEAKPYKYNSEPRWGSEEN